MLGFITAISDLISAIIGLVLSFFSMIVSIFTLIPTGLSYAISAIAWLPDWALAFAYFGVCVGVVLFILNRGGD